MSIGLLLKAKLKAGLISRLSGRAGTTEETLQHMGKWCERFCADLEATTYLGTRDGVPILFCNLHPAAENVEISFVDPSHFTVSANTSTVGPGYHIFLCEMLHRLGDEFQAVWENPTDDYCDETGYFHSEQQDRVFEEMTRWLEALANSFFDGTLSTETGPTRLALPLDCGFDWDARALTPLDPRDTEWLQRTARNGSEGRDFFAWWAPGLNAEHFLGRALAEMWSDIRWRAPVNDFERKNLRYVAASLKGAHKLNEMLAYPWAEWAAILDLLELHDDDYSFVRRYAQGSQPLIGYRRRNVTVRLPGNWWINLPGSFSEFLEDGDALCAQAPPRTIWYSGFAFTGDSKQPFVDWRANLNSMGMDLFEEAEGYVAAAKIRPGSEEGHEYLVLSSCNVCLTGRCVLTIVFTQPEDRDWAIGVWKSLQPPNPPRR